MSLLSVFEVHPSMFKAQVLLCFLVSTSFFAPPLYIGAQKLAYQHPGRSKTLTEKDRIHTQGVFSFLCNCIIKLKLRLDIQIFGIKLGL